MADDLRERFAAYAHDAWSGWMQHMFRRNANPVDTCLVIPKGLSERWYRLMNTPYAQLTEKEKASDRVEAGRMIAIVDATHIELEKEVAKLRRALQRRDKRIQELEGSQFYKVEVVHELRPLGVVKG